jgi:hypothetical protein
MDIGCLVLVCLGNNLIREPYDRGIVLVNAARFDVERLVLVCLVDQLTQCVLNRPTAGVSDRGVEESLDVTPQTQGIPYRQAREGPSDIMTSIEIMGIVDQDIENLTLLLQREPMVSAEVIVAQIIEKLGISQGSSVVRNIGAVEEGTQSLSEHGFRDSVSFEKQTFQVG